MIGLSIDVMVMAPLFPGATRQTEWKPIIPLLAGSLIATPLGVYILLILSPDTMRVFDCFIGDRIGNSNDEWPDLSGQQNNVAFL